jgi:aryl carrier-like protein
MLEFLGRLDNQIKLRGFRIELGEIESVLTSHPAIAQAVVSLREDVPGERRLVGYLVPAAGSLPAAADLRSFLLTRLPDYMAPAAYVTIDTMPLTPNGKIDRRALPAPDWSKRSRAVPYEAPATPDEGTMASIWEEVLRLKQVGRNDNLFELGADSLHVFQIAARAGKAGIGVTPRQILQHRTIAAIFAELAKGGQVKSQAPTIKPVPREKFRLTSQALQ